MVWQGALSYLMRPLSLGCTDAISAGYLVCNCVGVGGVCPHECQESFMVIKKYNIQGTSLRNAKPLETLYLVQRLIASQDIICVW